jgi:hypothetical protein
MDGGTIVTKQSGLGDNLYVDGYDLSGDTGSLGRIGGGPQALELTGINKSAYERKGGTRGGAIEWSSWFNPTNAHVALASLPRTDRYVTYCRGTSIGSPAASCMGVQVNYDPNRGQDGSLTIGVSVQSDQYGLEWGNLLTAGLRTDTTATDGTSLDGLASTVFGLQAYLHVNAFTGTSVTVKLQDSADNSNWLDISSATFVAATAVGSQRIAVTGTVRRYVRAVTTGTFSNAVFAVNFVRNETAVVF